MSMYEVTIPEPTTKNTRGELWGLVEWILENMTLLTSTEEGHQIITAIAPILIPLKGLEQSGKKFRATLGQLEKIREVCQPRNSIPMENLLAVSGYLQALRMAKPVEEKKE